VHTKRCKQFKTSEKPVGAVGALGAFGGHGPSVLSAFSAKTLYKKQQGRKTVLLR
jgi:hypothetical protein